MSDVFPTCGSCAERPATMIVWGPALGAENAGPRCYGCLAGALGHDEVRAAERDGGIYRLPQPDIEMGRWVYCSQHVRAHTTGWCSVPVGEKTALHALSAEEAYAECRERGLQILHDRV